MAATLKDLMLAQGINPSGPVPAGADVQFQGADAVDDSFRTMSGVNPLNPTNDGVVTSNSPRGEIRGVDPERFIGSEFAHAPGDQTEGGTLLTAVPLFVVDES